MSSLLAAILGLVQGLTEFLPISSSGHLVLLEKLFEMNASEGIALAVLLHVATLLAVVVVFRRDILKLFTTGREELGLLALGTVPAGVVGLTVKLAARDAFETLAGTTAAVGAALIGTGVVLFLAGLYMRRRSSDGTLTWRHALVIGLAQALAIMPGLSRSGMTIAAAIMCGIMLDGAVRFSFLLAIPVIAGGAMLELRDLQGMAASVGWLPLGVGSVVAFASGVAALKVVVLSVRKRMFPCFGFYCVPVGILVVVLSLAGVWK